MEAVKDEGLLEQVHIDKLDPSIDFFFIWWSSVLCGNTSVGAKKMSVSFPCDAVAATHVYYASVCLASPATVSLLAGTLESPPIFSEEESSLMAYRTPSTQNDVTTASEPPGVVSCEAGSHADGLRYPIDTK